MARRLILDTGVLIVAERSTLDLGSVIGDDDDVVIAAISVAELYAGIELADGETAPGDQHSSHTCSNSYPLSSMTSRSRKPMGGSWPTFTAPAPAEVLMT
jgi:hypothetical protein